MPITKDIPKLDYKLDPVSGIVPVTDTSYQVDLKKYYDLTNKSIDKLTDSIDRLRKMGLDINEDADGQPDLSDIDASIEKLYGDIMAKYDVAPSGTITTYNKMVEQRDKDLAAIVNILAQDIGKLQDFSFKDAPDDIRRKIDAAIGGLAADASTLTQMDSGLKAINEFNNVYNTSVLEYDKAVDKAKELDKEITGYVTDEIEQFINDQQSLEIMSPEDLKKHFEYYNDNQAVIDNIIKLSQEF